MKMEHLDKQLVDKLHVWMSENNIKPYGPIREGFGGFRQHGATRKGNKHYLVNRYGIHLWRGVKKGWKKLV